VELDELREGLAGLDDCSDEDVQQIMLEIDVNHEGGITFKQFIGSIAEVEKKGSKLGMLMKRSGWMKFLDEAANISSGQNLYDERISCAVCMGADRSVIFEPCDHVAVCLDCDDLLKTQDKYQCPICREGVIRSRRVFL
jgi:hypothetical protein